MWAVGRRCSIGHSGGRCVRRKAVGRSGKLASSVVLLGILPLLCNLDLSMATKGTFVNKVGWAHSGRGAASRYRSAETCLEAAAT